MTFSQALKRGASFREAWAGVRAGKVSPPPKGRRRNAGMVPGLTGALPGLSIWKAFPGARAMFPGRMVGHSAWGLPATANPTKHFDVIRLADPRRFDPRSFRTVTPRRGVRVTIGCPKGKYDVKRKRCKVGTRAQREMIRRNDPGAVAVDMLEHGAIVTRHVFPSMKMLYAHMDADASLRAALTGKSYKGIHFQTVMYTPTAGRAFARNARRRVNAPRAVEVYGNVEKIFAQKGRSSLYPGERFQHRFTTRPRMLGLPSGDLLITGR